MSNNSCPATNNTSAPTAPQPAAFVHTDSVKQINYKKGMEKITGIPYGGDACGSPPASSGGGDCLGKVFSGIGQMLTGNLVGGFMTLTGMKNT